MYRYFDPRRRVAVEIFDATEAEFSHPLEDQLLRAHWDRLQGHLQRVELGEREIGLVYKNDRLSGVLMPGSRQLYWRSPVEVRVEAVDISEDYRVAPDIGVLLRQPRAKLQRDVHNAVLQVEVGDHQLGLLQVNGELQDTLRPGRYAFWQFQRELQVELVDLRLQSMDVSGQEILTKDKVSLRINLAASYRVTDPVKLRAAVGSGKDFLYRELQFGLRQAVGTRTLDELLANKDELDQVVFAHASGRAAEHGMELQGVGVKDVILPGDMKDILNQVVEAEKVAQANVIKRREETAATRSLLNTAKLMDDNPTLLRLKELETLEKVTGKIDKLTVFGGLEGVLSELVSLKAR